MFCYVTSEARTADFVFGMKIARAILVASLL